MSNAGAVIACPLPHVTTTVREVCSFLPFENPEADCGVPDNHVRTADITTNARVLTGTTRA
jgi:hypothetical protein